MTRQRIALYALLAVVAAAAAVLSFSALRDLATVCGFAPSLAWLLPVVIDAGAAAGSLAWLGSAAPSARTYGRALALLLLASSVGGNALGHGLAAYAARPHWLVVVAVSAVAPAVLGALVHLVVLAVRPAVPEHVDEGEPAGEPAVPAVPALVEQRDEPVPDDGPEHVPAVPARRGTDDEIVQHLREHGLPSRRQLNKVLVCGTDRYDRLLAEAREPNLRSVL